MTVQAYQFAGGYGIVAIPNATIIASRDPATTDTISPDGNPYTPGQYWQNKVSGNLFVNVATGVWDPVSGSGITVLTQLTGDTGTAVPTAGSIKLAGTANHITTAATASTVTFTIPAVFIAPGSIASTTTITSGNPPMSSTTTITAGTGITSTTGNIVASAGNINATAGSMTAGTTIAAGTTITAGTGITSTTEILLPQQVISMLHWVRCLLVHYNYSRNDINSYFGSDYGYQREFRSHRSGHRNSFKFWHYLGYNYSDA